MTILDKTKVGDSVQVNIELSRDRLNQETIDAIQISSIGKITDFIHTVTRACCTVGNILEKLWQYSCRKLILVTLLLLVMQ